VKGVMVVAATFALSVGSLVGDRVFRPDPMPSRIEWGATPPPERAEVTTEDGVAIAGYRWKPRCEPHVAMVFFHGNGGNRYTAADLAAPMRRDDVDLIVASYRGYGDNPGEPSEDGLHRDAAAFVRLAKGTRPAKLYLFGFSLGGAVAMHAANEFRPDGLITLGAFSSLKSVAPPLVRPLVPDEFDNLAEVERLETPWLLLHGTADETVPLREAEKLRKAAGEKAQLIRLTGAPHNVALDQIAPRLWGEIARLPEAARRPFADENWSISGAGAAPACSDLPDAQLSGVSLPGG
jgi:uncharacterized protein